jgi:phage nucleotide-binding protein
MSLTAIAGLPVRKVSDYPLHVNMLIYGDSGSGKTTLAGSADEVPEMRKVLIVDIEGGTLSLKTRYPNIESVRIKSWDDMQKVYDELYANKHGYNTIVVDSLTEAQKMSMDEVMRKLIATHEERDADVPGIREWNINIEQTRKFVRAFRDLPVTTIFTALAKSDVNKRTGLTRTKPSLAGKVADEVAGFLDIVAYLYTREVDGEQKRILLCGATQDTVAKDRTDKLGQIIVQPSMSQIWKSIKEITENDNAPQGELL